MGPLFLRTVFDRLIKLWSRCFLFLFSDQMDHLQIVQNLRLFYQKLSLVIIKYFVLTTKKIHRYVEL